jgi:hypothetical protein
MPALGLISMVVFISSCEPPTVLVIKNKTGKSVTAITANSTHPLRNDEQVEMMMPVVPKLTIVDGQQTLTYDLIYPPEPYIESKDTSMRVVWAYIEPDGTIRILPPGAPAFQSRTSEPTGYILEPKKQ